MKNRIFLKVFKYVLISTNLLLCVDCSLAHARELLTADKALKTIFPMADTFETKEIVLSPEQISAVEKSADITFAGAYSKNIIIYEARAKNSVAGYAFEDTVMGKWGPIHFLTGLNAEGRVLQVMVLDYKEIRGRPIAKKRFLNQYKGKTVRDAITLRNDIDGVTGATISSRSLTDGVRKLVHVYEAIKSEFKKD